MKKYIYLALCVVLTAVALYFAVLVIDGEKSIANCLLCAISAVGSVASSGLYYGARKSIA